MDGCNRKIKKLIFYLLNGMIKLEEVLKNVATYRNKKYIINLTQIPMEIYDCNIYDNELNYISFEKSEYWNNINAHDIPLENMCIIVISKNQELSVKVKNFIKSNPTVLLANVDEDNGKIIYSEKKLIIKKEKSNETLSDPDIRSNKQFQYLDEFHINQLILLILSLN